MEMGVLIRLQVSEVKTLGNGLLWICEHAKKEEYCAVFIQDKRKKPKQSQKR